MEYNVIWIDDEWDTRGASFIETCKLRHQIYISAYKTRKEGIAALERNLKHWDAVILDAKAYNNSTDCEVTDVDGLYAARERLIELRQQRYIPFFVFTRQPDLFDNRMFEKSVGKFYKKDLEGQKQLIVDLKDEVSKSSRFQIKTIYYDRIEVLKEISVETCEDIVDILEAMHHPELPFTPKYHFNPLRQALEYIFRAAIKAGIIPDDFAKTGNVNLHQCYTFLKGGEPDWIRIRYGQPGEFVIPTHIQNMMYLVIELGNKNSHSKLTDLEILEVENRILNEGINSKYLVYSMALQLCEIAAWMNRYISDHPNREKNLEMCKPLIGSEDEKQTIVKDEKGIKRLLGAINKERDKVYSYDLGKNIIIDKKSGFNKNCSPKEYDYADNEKVYFELKEQINPKTNKAFSFAINVNPARKEKPKDINNE